MKLPSIVSLSKSGIGAMGGMKVAEVVLKLLLSSVTVVPVAVVLCEFVVEEQLLIAGIISFDLCKSNASLSCDNFEKFTRIAGTHLIS